MQVWSMYILFYMANIGIMCIYLFSSQKVHCNFSFHNFFIFIFFAFIFCIFFRCSSATAFYFNELSTITNTMTRFVRVSSNRMHNFAGNFFLYNSMCYFHKINKNIEWEWEREEEKEGGREKEREIQKKVGERGNVR